MTKTVAAASVLILAAPVFGQDDLTTNPGGLYLTFSGMGIFTQDSDLSDNTGATSDAVFDPGFGLRVGVGYTFPAPESPVALTLELEYFFQFAEIDRIDSVSAGGDYYSDSIMGNLILDFNIVGGFGLYVGAGIGVTVVSADLDGVGGSEDVQFAWQVLGGLKYAIDEHWVVYLGTRYFDAGNVNFDALDSEYQTIAVEAGFRFYF